MKRLLINAALTLVLCGSAVARADSTIQTSGPELFPSKHELTATLGYQAGFGGKYQNPSGIKLTAEYAYRFHELVWFDVQLSNVFGFGSTSGSCAQDFLSQCYRGGWDVGIAGGVKLKWRTPIPIVLELPILVGVDILYNRDCGDTGAAAPVFRTGFSGRYFLKRNIAVGAGINFGFGPGFHGGSNYAACQRSSYTDFYGAFDFSIGAEFLL